MTGRQSPDNGSFAAEPRSVDLRDYWLIVRRRWVLVVALTVIGVIAGLLYAHSVRPSYSATSQVVVTPLAQGPLNPPTQVNLQVNMSTEQAVAQSSLVAVGAAQLLHVRPTVLQAGAAKRLTVSVPANTLTTSDVLQITWEAGSPQAAQAGANAFAQAYLSSRHRELADEVTRLESSLNAQVALLQKQITGLTAELGKLPAGSPAQQNLMNRLNELTAQTSTTGGQLASLPSYNDSGGNFIAAALPLAPSGIGRKVILVVGALLGLLLGLVLAFVRDSFDDRVRDTEQLELKLGAATLAVLIEGEKTARGSRGDPGRRPLPMIAAAARQESPAAESVRALRATLLAVAARRDLRTLLVCSADASISSSRIAAELGVALAESDRRVLLIAADMRSSLLPELFNLPNDFGLSDVLGNGSDPKVLTRHARQAADIALPEATAGRLSVLPSGPPTSRALAVLDSEAMLDLLRSQRASYEFVVLDSPPATVAADVFTLATHVDGVIVIAREARTTGRAIEDLRRRLDQVDALIIGGVFIAKGSAAHHRHEPGHLQPIVDDPSAAVKSPPAGKQSDHPRRPDLTLPFAAISDDEVPEPYAKDQR